MDAILAVRDLKTWFPVRSGVFRKVTGFVRAVDEVTFSVGRDEVFALVGESGCGKSTTGMSVLRLIEPTAGEVRFDGADLTRLGAEALRERRRDMQMVFQNPGSALNPRMTAASLLAEPLRLHFRLSPAELRDRVEDMFALVGMRPDQLDRYPHQFSGGQKQRLSIARALISRPRFLVADEPVSALDVSIQAQILNLLMRTQAEMALSMVFISHDLHVVRHIASRVAVMYLGRIVEMGAAGAVFARPAHPYTRALLDAAPRRDPSARRRRVLLEGEAPSPSNPPPGCPFHTRCPAADPFCRESIPSLREIAPDHAAACSRAL